MKTISRKPIKKIPKTKLKPQAKPTKKIAKPIKKITPKTKKITKKVKPIKPIKKVKVTKKVVKKVVKKPIKKLVPKAAKPIKVVKTKPAVAKATKHLGYTDAQFETYKNLIKDYSSKTNDQLKEVLRVNTQSKSGDKKLLLEKVADGEIKGGIPRCPSCGGGYLKYDYKTDIYSCKGYMDDTDWKFCNFRGNSSNVTRSPWVKPAGF
jgi:hypothetical protein